MAICNEKTLRGIHGMGRKLGYGHEELREMVSTGSLRLVPQDEADQLFRWLREQVDAQTHPGGRTQGSPLRGGQGRGPWRLYSSSTLCREIEHYAREIHWEKADGFRSWLLTYFGIEDLRFVSSFKQATAIKNALKRMANEERGR